MVQRASIGSIDLYYRDVGEGPPVVFLHGFGGNHLSWWQQLATFADDHRCIAPDQRGFGLSADAPDGPGVAAFVDDLVALLDDLAVERPAVVGHSMSGWPAASLATQHPDRVAGLVLSGSPGGLLSPDRHGALLEEAAGSLPDVAPLEPDLEFLSESISGLNVHAPASFGDVRPTLEELPADAEAIGDADVPVLLIAGEADGFMPPAALDALSDRIDGAETAVVEGAGHSAHFERPAAFDRHLRRFLEERATF